MLDAVTMENLVELSKGSSRDLLVRQQLPAILTSKTYGIVQASVSTGALAEDDDLLLTLRVLRNLCAAGSTACRQMSDAGLALCLANLPDTISLATPSSVFTLLR
jgi:hypothetical protein